MSQAIRDPVPPLPQGWAARQRDVGAAIHRAVPFFVLTCLCLLSLPVSDAATISGSPPPNPPNTPATDAATERHGLEGRSGRKSPTAPSAGASTRPPAELTIAAAGDVLLHNGLWAQAAADAGRAGQHGYDFRPMLAGVRPDISGADLAVCHLETVVGPAAGPFTGYPRFVVPPQIVPALKDAGYDTCSTASNHALDDGESGIRRTLDALDAVGLAHSGTARSAQEHARTTMVNAGGVRIATLAYASSFNGLRRPAGREWLANTIQAQTILDEAGQARRAGAEIVVVSIHWGVEYSQAASDAQVALARRLLASPDVDLLLGHHAHVVAPMERINGKWVVYGMGNHVARQPQRATTQDGVIVRLTFRRTADAYWSAANAVAVPTWMDLAGLSESGAVRLLSVPRVLADRSTPMPLRQACLRSLGRTTAALTSRGGAAAGLVILQS